MSYTNESGRDQILHDAAAAAADLGEALAFLGEVYDHLDEASAERMEATIFRPVQTALATLRRTQTEFAARHGRDAGGFTSAPEPAPGDPRGLLERAGDAVARADETIAELQDSLLPVEVGDEALRAGLSRTRTLIGPVPRACDALVRTVGR